ncbi:MAG: hypothetical protein QXO54_04845 [Candidatus Methanomethylicaceae archaeon]
MPIPSFTPFTLQNAPTDGGVPLRSLTLSRVGCLGRPQGDVEACRPVSVRNGTKIDRTKSKKLMQTNQKILKITARNSVGVPSMAVGGIFQAGSHPRLFLSGDPHGKGGSGIDINSPRAYVTERLPWRART